MAELNLSLVRDIMVPVEEYPTVSQGATIHEAMAALRATFHKDGVNWQGPHALVVGDDNGRVVGMLSLNNLLSSISIKDLEDDVWQKAETWGWYCIKKLREATGLSVRDLMRPIDLVTVSARDKVIDAAQEFLAHRVNWVAVMERGRVVGILRTIDIFPVIDTLISGKG